MLGPPCTLNAGTAAGHEQGAYALLHPGAEWEHYRCFNRELPPLEGLADRFHGVLVSGSHYSSYEGAYVHGGSCK